MIFSRMVGGLGNQLFQTAACLKYRKQREKVIISFLGDIHVPKRVNCLNDIFERPNWLYYNNSNDLNIIKKCVAKVSASLRFGSYLPFISINDRNFSSRDYFNSEKNPIEHVGLLKTNGKLEEPASHSVYRDSERYFMSRGAFGVTYSGNADIAWCSTKNDSIFEWERPLTNRPGYPNDSLPFSSAYYWDVRDALHAGPVLISDGEIDLNIEDEVFFNTPVAGVQPRSAIGYTKDQHLVLMVVDGRQAESRGVYLEELALMMSEFNCIEALNLDGGGSSAMVADSRLLNRPSGRTVQREVMSAIGIFYK